MKNEECIIKNKKTSVLIILNTRMILHSSFFILHFLYYLCTRCSATANQYSIGEMVEWSITPVLKTVVPRGTGGSNPSLSAKCERRSHFFMQKSADFQYVSGFFVGKTANCSHFYVETERSHFCVSVRIFGFAFLIFHEIRAKMPI